MEGYFTIMVSICHIDKYQTVGNLPVFSKIIDSLKNTRILVKSEGKSCVPDGC